MAEQGESAVLAVGIPRRRPLGRQRLQWGARDLVVLAVAMHSITLGISLLFFPLPALRLVGWAYAGPAFWPSQAGLFLVILGVAYALAVRTRPLVWLIVGSKAGAVVFLFTSVVMGNAPPVVARLACGDGLMALAVLVVCRREKRTGDSA